MTEVYTRDRGVATANPQEDRGVGKIIEAAKALIPTIDLADLLCGPGQMRRVGDRWVARCPLPDHDERTASFTVYPGDRGWWCYGCGRGGDVVDLARIAWGFPDDGRGAAEAAGFLLLEFGHEIPERKPAWFRRQERQAPIRDRIEQTRVEHIRLLVFRLLWMPWLRRLPEDIREEATADAWAESRHTARQLYGQRRGA
ncbi:MAG: hypothetical protein H0U04_08650 [Rubrobacter sp.]|nr:hypothetical protein [Rubrobacter sp.]